jgi:glycosidase
MFSLSPYLAKPDTMLYRVSLDGAAHDKFLPQTWTLPQLKRIVSKWQTMMLHHAGWNALYLENHDQPRTISRFASDAPQFRAASAKMLATFMALQSGTPYIYQGQEMGQINVSREWGIDRYRDIETLNHWQKVLREHGEDETFQAVILEEYRKKARDNARTPMQWDGSRHAGFTTAERPWMDVHPDYGEWNVAKQVADQGSVFSYWKAVLRLRKESKGLFVYGGFEMLDFENEDIVAYLRTWDQVNRALVVTSFRDREVDWEVPEIVRSMLDCPVPLKNYEDGPKVEGTSKLRLRPFEALVFVRSG